MKKAPCNGDLLHGAEAWGGRKCEAENAMLVSILLGYRDDSWVGFVTSGLWKVEKRTHLPVETSEGSLSYRKYPRPSLTSLRAILCVFGDYPGRSRLHHLYPRLCPRHSRGAVGSEF